MIKERYTPLDNLELHFRSARDSRGLLTFAEEMKDFPFALKRMFWITDVPVGARRGGHAHTTCKEVVCCVKGSFRLVVSNGREIREFTLDSPDHAVIIPEGVWCSLEDFAKDTVVVVGASEEYDTGGYIRDYDEYMTIYGTGGRREL
ncbi:MAG: FdtA/QdtA family cupin domain-containing protein [Bacteroidaceae bacterium]|jgi:dTDP-4-dehydrorhamnose 3,5-epimerase-like enzyme|nr:FdtA/QdtA family cupin domain-containing protein [Bacteroidaceae bacterium]